ncbi:MAG: ribosome recycling factor [Candidatus Peregrinibacteria bacterium Greene0416_62]|nr:MAG: ribosome recycling factor [Candidatus Peregrinibacteria bacterium Greene0416_62]TSC99237.1 MAG: ribosome recycling factor [Candidatus Peregrinibacteria bacterium Greene1014_49]
MPTDPRLISFQQSSEKVYAHLLTEFSRLQTGRASAALVEHISVEAYGQRQPLKAVAGISIGDSKTIVIQPWDRSVMGDVERALQVGDLGASVQNDGTVIRVILPAMNQERREQLVKVVAKLSEEGKISLRQQRQTVHDKIKSEEKDEDQRFTLLEFLDKATKDTNLKIDEAKKQKEEELMKI